MCEFSVIYSRRIYLDEFPGHSSLGNDEREILFNLSGRLFEAGDAYGIALLGNMGQACSRDSSC
jgi:hypothetical protein